MSRSRAHPQKAQVKSLKIFLELSRVSRVSQGHLEPSSPGGGEARSAGLRRNSVTGTQEERTAQHELQLGKRQSVLKTGHDSTETVGKRKDWSLVPPILSSADVSFGQTQGKLSWLGRLRGHPHRSDRGMEQGNVPKGQCIEDVVPTLWCCWGGVNC